MKKENEITVEITCSYDELTELLKSKGFEIINELILTDIYLIRESVDIDNTSDKEILSDYLIVRIPSNDNPVITYKWKVYNEDGSIKEQAKIDCDVMDSDVSLELLKKIGYKELFTIKNMIKFYKKENVLFVAAMVNDEYLCLEYSSPLDKPIDELIMEFEADYGYIPHNKSNYFINKAMIELEKVRNN